MSDIHNAYINALLADATYALDLNGLEGLKDDDLFKKLQSRMTDTLADYISKNFFVVTHVENGDVFGSGFDATVWQGKDNTEFAGKTYVSMQGTTGLGDFITDVDLTVSGVAKNQIVDMVNWWLKNTTAAGQLAQQIMVASLGMSPAAVFINAPTVLGTGILHDVSNVIVDGHSLGGHLATAFTRLFGGPAGVSVEHTYTYNSAGFTLTSDALFSQIESLLGAGVSKGYFEGVVGQTNFFAENGINATTRTFSITTICIKSPMH
jgi:hypothetical protein